MPIRCTMVVAHAAMASGRPGVISTQASSLASRTAALGPDLHRPHGAAEQRLRAPARGPLGAQPQHRGNRGGPEAAQRGMPHLKTCRTRTSRA